MDIREVKSHDVGCYVNHMWVVCRGCNMEVVAVLDSQVYAEQLSTYLAQRDLEEYDYYEVPTLSSIVE